MRHVGNTFKAETELDNPDASRYFVYSHNAMSDRSGSLRRLEWEDHCDYIRRCTIGDPTACGGRTVEEMKEAGYVGLYMPEETE